jgi:hypothetical protein
MNVCKYLAKYLLERNMFQIKDVEGNEMHTLYAVHLSRKSLRFRDN